ncbi:MAG: glycoside hydrolase family 172 protein [Candidatus Geothermincolia bacterium]
MFLNLSKDVFGIGPHDGVTCQYTSFGRRGSALPGLAGRAADKCVDLAPGKPFEAADIEGPGLITRIWVTLPGAANPGALRNVVVKIFWDDEAEPSVLTPLGDLFGATFAHPVDYSSAYTAITSGGFLCFFPMPFRRRARVVLENQGRLSVRLFFYQVTCLKLKGELPKGVPYLHCLWRRERLERNAPPYTVLDARGRGFYMGCHLDMQGTGYPWRPNPARWFLPEGFGMGMLEGWERMWIDRDAGGEPNVHGTGGEDYFNGAWYFTRVPSISLTHGVTMRNRVTRRVSCYRMHAEMPVAFDERIKVTIDHGFNNALPAIYDGVAFWYQDEPHSTTGDLPPASDRHPEGALKAALVMSMPLLYGGAALAGIRRIHRGRCH